MASIIPLPARPVDRGARPAAAGPAALFVFPPARHMRVVEAIANEMREKTNDQDAENILVAHLELEIYRLMRFGLDEAQIEKVCRDFARAAWASVDRNNNNAGVA